MFAAIKSWFKTWRYDVRAELRGDAPDLPSEADVRRYVASGYAKDIAAFAKSIQTTTMPPTTGTLFWVLMELYPLPAHDLLGDVDSKVATNNDYKQVVN